MEYIDQESYEYIINKYHDGGRPLLPGESRFVRQDRYFDPATGMDGDEILAAILQNDEKNLHLPHSLRKALALEFVLKNTRISCDRRDRFPAINSVDRPLKKTLIVKWTKELTAEFIPEAERQRDFLRKEGAAAIWLDYDHSVPHWERVFALGFSGLLAESERIRSQKKDLTADQTAFYDAIRIAYGAILGFVSRLEEQAKKEGNGRLEKALSTVKCGPPRTFYEALVLEYIYFMISEQVDNQQVRSLSNFDRIFYPYYQRDLSLGVPEEEIRRDLAYFFLQFTAIGNYWNQPVFLGGCKEDGSTEINELSELFLDVYDKMGLYNPKIQIKLADSTPKPFVLKALDMIRRGKNSVVFVNDAAIRRSLENAGVSPEEARLCNIKGCYEYSPQESYISETNYLSLLKPLEYALHEGRDGITGNLSGLSCRKPGEYASFEELFAEYKRQLAALIEKAVGIVNAFEDYFDFVNPQPVLSATYSSALEKGRDALQGGSVRNESHLLFGFTADTADSLAAIKKRVFDRKELSLEEFTKILDQNFEGHELFRRKLLADRDKYGNNKDLPDRIAVEIVDFVTSKVAGRPNAKRRDGQWNLGFHVARQSYALAPATAASANGRLKGQELSKNLSASMGMNREGATAAILTVTKIDATKFTNDACLDLGLLPSAVKGDDGLEAMFALLMTFKKRGGHAMHINVFDAETLRQAQREPEKYQDLQIRVCGWNVLFHNISREEQDGFIRQAEGLC